MAQDVPHPPASVALIPGSIEVLGDASELHDQVAGQVLRLRLAPFLPPQPDQGGLVRPHDGPRIRAAEERTAIAPSFIALVLHNFSFNIIYINI